MEHDRYNDELECPDCGEEDDLSHEYTDSGWDKYTCRKCGHPFRIRSTNE